MGWGHLALASALTIVLLDWQSIISVRYPSWKAVIPDIPITWDLEGKPLFIKTDSQVGSGDLLRFFTRADNGTHLASFYLEFTSPTIKYRVRWCKFDDESWITDVLAEPPTDKLKVWGIAKNSSSLTVTCNAVEVLVVLFSTSSNKADCMPRWEGDVVGEIMFAGPTKSFSAQDGEIDTASDYYSNWDPWLLIGKFNDWISRHKADKTLSHYSLHTIPPSQYKTHTLPQLYNN